MGEIDSIHNTLEALRTHAKGSEDSSLLNLIVEMEAKLTEPEPHIKVGDISNSTAVAIGNGIDIVVNQSNVPEALVVQLTNLLNALGKPDTKLPEWTRGKSPFPGLRAFGEEYAPVFFGRQTEIDQLLTRLSKPDCRFLMIVGASGSGKSSLVKAGLIPQFNKGALDGSENWSVITFTPDAFGKGDPFDVLAYTLSQTLPEVDIQKTNSLLREKRSGLRETLDNALQGSDNRTLLVIDQFEELFSRVVDDSLSKQFQESINEAAKSPRILTIVTMRDDFYHHFVKSPVLSRLINRNTDSTFTLSAPGQLDLYEMINGPARVADLHFENGLVSKILNDTGNEPGALALLAYALDQLHKASLDDDIMTFAEYDSFGGVQGAIGTRAQETFEKLSEDAQKSLSQVFREMLEVDESGTATRKRAPLERVERDDASRELVGAFVEARLLVTSLSVENQALVEVAHEALFRSWPKLKDWIEETQDDLILLRQVRTAADWWDKNDCRTEFLWPDERLQPVYAMRERLNPDLNETEQEFIRLEVERLWEEIENPETSHHRRSWIGERLNTLGDPRPGVGLVNDILPLRPEEDGTGLSALRTGEVRLWGDKPEHKGLPDIVWVKVDGGSIHQIEDLTFKQLKKQTFKVQPFYIAKYPITFMQFKAFMVARDGFNFYDKNSHIRKWYSRLRIELVDKDNTYDQYFKFNNHPRDNVSYFDTIAFCRWLNARLNWEEIDTNINLYAFRGLRLPTEWEWQWAATGGDVTYKYPWGAKWDANKTNTFESGLGRTAAVGVFPQGASPYGLMDMIGNVYEWCVNSEEFTGHIKLGGSEIYSRVVRGSSYLPDRNVPIIYRGNKQKRICTFDRWTWDEDQREPALGFRLVVRPPSL